MKKKYLLLTSLALAFTLSACGSSSSPASSSSSQPSSGSSQGGSDTSQTSSQSPVVHGLPLPATGHYMKDADIIQAANGDRLLVYTTNEQSGDEDNVIAIRKGVKDATDYVYGNEHIIIRPSATGWDQYLGSASITKGVFAFNGTNYSYLLAYNAGDDAEENANSIGLAVANDPLGTWLKVNADEPALYYDSDVYGAGMKGFYGPSLVNLDKESVVRIFYTRADAYGHFAYFVDVDASDLSAFDPSGYVMVPTNGDLTGGDDTTMIPNSDFAYDAEEEQFYMIKDYSPAASKRPKVSTRIELAVIDEAELYTTDVLAGWESLALYDFTDTPNLEYERLYAATIVADEFGHLLSSEEIELVYNVSELEADNANYLFTQKLITLIYEA